VGKNKLAKWTEFGSFDNVIQPKIGDIASSDHPIKGRWKTEMFKNENPVILELGCGKGEYSNVAFLRTRIEFINSFFNTDEIDEIWITFPDPHPGGRNASKRLPSPRFLNSYRSFLKNNGVVHLKTDNLELFNYTKSVAIYNNLEVLFDTDDDILSIRTHYEKLFMNRGMKINYISFKLPKDKMIEDATGKTKGEE
jgi:tRNA (guanine-N7-)-methyltransferase